MSWVCEELGVRVGGCPAEDAIDPAGRRALGASEWKYSGGEWGLCPDEGGLPVTGEPGVGLAGDFRGAYAADGGADGVAVVGFVHSGVPECLSLSNFLCKCGFG